MEQKGISMARFSPFLEQVLTTKFLLFSHIFFFTRKIFVLYAL